MKSEQSIPKTYLIEYEGSEEGGFGEKVEGPSENVIREFSNTFIRFIGLQLYFISLYDKEFKGYEKSAPEIRERIQKLNRRIDSLLKVSDSAKEKKKTVSKKEGEEMGEVALLHNASICFTNLMELDENLSNSIVLLNDILSTVERAEGDLGIKRIEANVGGSVVITPLIDHFQTLRNTILFGFTNLRENIVNSQSRLRNTVDSFKTYQENRRRKTSEKSEKVLNTVFILFAVLALADALGNFIILGAEKGDYLNAAMWFGIDLGILFVVIVLLYLFVLRRMFTDM